VLPPPGLFLFRGVVLTKKSKYGLKAVLYLAREARVGSGPIPAAQIAERERLPRKFLEAILLDLKRHGLLRSKKGPHGGYSLIRCPTEVTLGEIISALDTARPPVSCLGQGDASCAECEDQADCRSLAAMTEVQAAATRVLDRTTLSVLAAKTAP
jgi:Rrf2 family protein